ncbi:MAG: MFS transporter, partial [Myxococcota bacterium]
GTVMSQTGDFLQLMAQGWLVLLLTGSPLSLGLVGFAQAGPRLALAPLVGTLADRFDRRNLLLFAQGGFLLQTLVFAILVTTDRITFPQVIVLTVIWGVLNGINHTARQSLIPNIVPKEDIMSAIALHSAAFNFTRAVGPAIGGALVAWLGVAGCLWINAATFAPMFWMLLAMRTPDIHGERKKTSTRFRDALVFLRGEREVRMAVGLTFVAAFFVLSYSRLTPVFARDIFGGGPGTFGLLMSAHGVGAVASTLALASLGRTQHVPRLLPLVTLFLALMAAGFAVAPHLWIALLCLMIFGALQLTQRTMASSLLQTRTPDALRGRVTGLFQMDVGLWSLGSLAMGALAELTGVQGAVLVGAAFCCVFALPAAFVFRR